MEEEERDFTKKMYIVKVIAVIHGEYQNEVGHSRLLPQRV